jgi:hypothetical protein
MILDVLTNFPDIEPGFKVYVEDEQVYVDTSVRPVRTVLSILYEGYTRNDMVPALVSLVKHVKDYVEDLKNNTIYHTYRKQNHKVFSIKDPTTVSLLEHSKVIFAEVLRICKSLENLKTSYTNDTYIVECINNTQSSLTNYNAQLNNIQHIFDTTTV